MLFDPVMPLNPVYQATGTSHHTATKLGPSNSSDQLLDQANRNRRSVHQSSDSQASDALVYHANIRT
jgi:hypothetical protein